jgi:inner membrane protein YidH
MSANRTLMSIIRTALSLIGFGFTIYQFFRSLRESVTPGIRPDAARNFGFTLVLLGVLLLTFGIVGHIKFMLELRRDHSELVAESLIPDDRFPFSVTLGAALLLLLTGLLAILSMVGRSGPFR